jgi:Ca2+-binding RTX toxin-like protein
MIDLDRSIDTQVVVACEDAAANHDNTYDVTVLATSGALSDTQLLHVAVQNVSGATITGGKKSETVDATHAMKGQFATLEPDAINGKAGRDKIDGLGGNDTLTGGKDDDTFVFSTKLGAGNVDTITDFAHNHDAIALKHSKFKAIGTSLSSDEFYAHSKAHAAHDKSDRIIYDTKHGKLYYDADGKGGHDAVQFAALSDHPALDAGNFLIV